MTSAPSAIVYDVCDLDRIYQTDAFIYSLPKDILLSYLKGTAFDKKTPYTEEQSRRLRTDIETINRTILSKGPIKEKIAVMTAGAPGAGKTVLMEQDLARQNRTFAYIDPDAVCLKTMEHSYLADLKQQEPQAEDQAALQKIRKAAYDEWRPGSNAATHLILANLIREGYGFYFGTTATGPQTFRFMELLKKHGYQIRLIHLIAQDDVRWQSIEQRDSIFVQTTEADIRDKGKLLAQRIQDTYLKYADHIDFYYRAACNADAVLGATWDRLCEGHASESKGKLQIVNQAAYDAMKQIHNASCDAQGKPELRWEVTVEACSQ